MILKIKEHFLWPLLIILFISNIVLVVITIRRLKKTEDTNYSSQQNDSIFYDQPSPDIEIRNIQGVNNKLSDFVGNIIIIQFTEFLYNEFPKLLYLEHLYKCSQGNVSLFFVYPSKSKYSGLINDFNLLSVPIIEDDGPIQAIFNALVDDTIIIGKDFKIKFKSNYFSKYIIYNHVKRFLGDDFPNPFISQEELSSSIKKIDYINIENNEMVNLGMNITDKYSIVNIFISTCMDCSENKRIYLLNEIANEAQLDKTQIVLLFGYGNKFEMVKEFYEKNNLRKMIVGIIQASEELPHYDYYRIFRLNIDPRMFIFNKNANLIFAEDIENRRKISFDFITKELNR